MKIKLFKKKIEEKKQKRERRSIFERFTIKENIIIFSIFLLFLILIFNLIKSYAPYSYINYNNISLEEMLENSTIDYNRDNYWILNGIVLRFLHPEISVSSFNESDSDIKDVLLKYYDVLHEDYRVFLNKKKYIKLAEDIINNYNLNYEDLNNLNQEAPIRKIYKINEFNGDYFLVELNTKTDSYIGIWIDKETACYNIFYLK